MNEWIEQGMEAQENRENKGLAGEKCKNENMFIINFLKEGWGMGQRCVTERRGFWKHEIFIPLSSVFLQISFFYLKTVLQSLFMHFVW